MDGMQKMQEQFSVCGCRDARLVGPYSKNSPGVDLRVSPEGVKHKDVLNKNPPQHSVNCAHGGFVSERPDGKDISTPSLRHTAKYPGQD